MADDLGLVAGTSDGGRIREFNADAMAFGFTGNRASPGPVVAVTCDGVGSYRLAGRAAQDAADTGAAELLGCLADGVDARTASTIAMAAADHAVARLADTNGAGGDAPATTYVSAVATGTEVTVAWLGDSRAYWLAGGGTADAVVTDGSAVQAATCLTIDHTVRNSHLADGTRAAHTLTRWLGADSTGTDPQVVTVRPECSGTIVLCTDGLWGYAGDPAGLATRLPDSADLAGAAGSLVSYALDCGGRDNVTVVALPFRVGGGWR